MAEDQSLVQSENTSITRRLRDTYEQGQVALIKKTVAADCNDSELAIFLETCARHQLDPFIKEIWAIKIKGKVQIFASRDGLLGIANRHTPEGRYGVKGEGMFLGCQSGVVREHDLFATSLADREDETSKIVVDHQFRDKDGNPTHGGKDGTGRGEIVAGWARVRRKGHDDTFFMAYWNTYHRTQNAWPTHPDAMIPKCAEAVALRKAFSVSGIMGEGELTGAVQPSVTAVEAPQEVNWPDNEAQATRLKEAFGLLGYRQAKIRMVLNAVGAEGGDADHEALLRRLNSELDADQDVQDAEVVE